MKPTLFPSLLVFFVNTKPQIGKKCWERGLMCKSKVDFFPMSYPGLFYAVSCLHYMTQFLLLVWSSWMLESYFLQSRACKIQSFPRGANHGATKLSESLDIRLSKVGMSVHVWRRRDTFNCFIIPLYNVCNDYICSVYIVHI